MHQDSGSRACISDLNPILVGRGASALTHLALVATFSPQNVDGVNFALRYAHSIDLLVFVAVVTGAGFDGRECRLCRGTSFRDTRRGQTFDPPVNFKAQFSIQPVAPIAQK